MATNYTDFIHPSDKKALASLKAVPGFDLVVKKYMSLVGEKMYKITITSSFLKLGPDQLPEIYEILLKVCKRLDIAVPELYLELNREPNAYTYGDTDVFIVLHSGLLETMTMEQIEAVIAHECGHIACHHVLYRAMGNLILTGADIFVNGLISKAIVTSLQFAFAYWMRCSELSADRATAYYYASVEPVIDLMMAFSGGTSNLNLKLNREEFLRQAEDYKAMIDNSTYNKVLEFIQYGLKDHPLNAYRAYEINEFYKQNEEELTREYILRVTYEYIKAKGLKGLGRIFDNKPLEIEIGGEQYKIDKNKTQEIVLRYGNYEMEIKMGSKTITHSIALQKDKTVVVYWNSNDEELSVKEDE